MKNHYVSLWQMRTACQHRELVAHSSPDGYEIMGTRSKAETPGVARCSPLE